MASLTRHSKGWKVRYRIYYPDGASRVAFAYRVHQRDARYLLGLAGQVETLTRQNALTMESAIPFKHWRLLTDQDLVQWFPGRQSLAFDAGMLLDAYERHCRTQMTSPAAIYRNLFRAQKLLTRLGDLSRLTFPDLRLWQQERTQERARKTVNLELDVLRQLLDCCQELGWRADNPARQLKKLAWKQSRLPQALTLDQAAQVLDRSRTLSNEAPPQSLIGQLYRLVVAGLFFGLRRGELQYLLSTDTNGRQVFIQGKPLPDGQMWLPKDREARVVQYAGVERPITVVFAGVEAGYVFSPSPTREMPYHYDSLTAIVDKKLLRSLGQDLTLHSLRHTFATWRLEQGDSILQVKGLMGHGDANTLLRYAHVQQNPLTNLLALLP
jgi:site-specific recombinase XerD